MICGDDSGEGDDVYTTVDGCDSPVKHFKAMNKLMSIDRYLSMI